MFFNSNHPSKTSQNHPLVLEGSAWLLVNPPCLQRASAGAQELKLVFQAGTRMQVCSTRGEILEHWSNFLRNSLFPCRAEDVRCSPSSKAPCPSLPNEHLHMLLHKCLHSQLITSGIWCAFMALLLSCLRAGTLAQASCPLLSHTGTAGPPKSLLMHQVWELCQELQIPEGRENHLG